MTEPTSGAGRALRSLGLSGEEIEARSLDRLRAAAPVPLPPTPADAVALRMAYAAGDPSLLADVVADVDAVSRATEALREERAVVVDTHMALAGVATAARRAGVRVLCALDATPASASWLDPATAAAATTRSARGMIDALCATAPAAIVAVGTSPTALLAVCDLLADGMPAPAVVVATCCGLVGAAEAKDLLLATRERAGVAVVAVRGSRGGAGVAAAAVNALLGAAPLRSPLPPAVS